MKKNTENSQGSVLRPLAIFIIPAIIFIFMLILGFTAEGSQQFAHLADSFVHGKTYFLDPIGGQGQDPVFYNGHIYWGEGVFPAILLTPFVALFNLFHLFFFQGYLKWSMVIGISYFVYAIARKIKYSKEDSLILMFGFTLSSVFLGVNSVSSSWLFAQIVTTFLCFWSLYEYHNKRRLWLIGVICGLILMTRITAAPIIIFFLIMTLMEKTRRDAKLRNLAYLVIPFVIAGCFIGAYNNQRFGSPLNNGSKYQLLSAESSEARSMGVFSIKHLPTNLYTIVLRGPNIVLNDSTSWSLKFPYISNNSYGMSIFITSPYLLWLLTIRPKKYPKEAKQLMVPVLVSLVAVLTYFGIGADQLGYRYALDFMPGLFVVFMLVYKQINKDLTRGMKFLLLGPCVLNFYLLFSFIKF